MKNPINKFVTIGVIVVSSFLLNGCKKEQSLKPMTYSELVQNIEETKTYMLSGDIILKYDDENSKTINFTSEVDDNNFNVILSDGTCIKNLSKDDENIYINMDIDNLKGYLQLPYINIEQPTSKEYNILKNVILTTMQEHIKGYEKQDYISYFEYNINKNDEEFTNLISDILGIMQEYKPEIKKVMVEQFQYGKEILFQYIDLYVPYLKTVYSNDNEIDTYKTIINDNLSNIIEKLPYEIDQNINGMTVYDFLDNLNISKLFYSIGMKDNGDITLGIIIDIKEFSTYYTQTPNEIKINLTLTPTEFAEDLSFTPTTNFYITVDKALRVLIPMVLGFDV